MKQYARIDNGMVVEIIAAVYGDDASEIPIAVRFHPEIAATLVEIPAGQSVAQGWTYDGTTFATPVALIESTSDARARALVDIRAQRGPILDALAGIGFDAMVSGDSNTIQGVANARTALKDITSDAGFISATTYDDMKAAIMAQYRLAAAVAPDSVRVAFAALLT